MTWIPLGPSCTLRDAAGETAPVTGACTAIAFDPTEPGAIYIGTAGGGVWRTRDGGNHWEPLTDGQLSLAIGALAIGRSGRIYAGTGDGTRDVATPKKGPLVLKGRGLLISDDHGATWELKPGIKATGPTDVVFDALVGKQINDIVVFPDDDRHVVIATSYGLLESTDGGHNLDPLEFDQTTVMHITSAVLDPDDPAGPTLYVGVRGVGVMRRRGTGPLELLLSTGLSFVGRIELAVSSAPVVTPTGTRRLVYFVSEIDGSHGVDAFKRSRDGGDSWEDVDAGLRDAQGTSSSRGIGRFVIAVDPEEPETVFFGATHLFRRAQDTGTWERLGKTAKDQLHPDQLALAFDPRIEPGKPPMLWVGNEGGVWRSADRGATWAHRNRGLQTALLNSVSTYPGASVLLGGSQGNGAQRSDGHPLWSVLHVDEQGFEDVSFSAFDTAIDPHRPAHWYYGVVHTTRFAAPRLQRSTDGGVRFSEIGPVVTDPLGFQRKFILVSKASDEQAQVVLAGRDVFASTSVTERWTTLVTDLFVDPPGNPTEDYVSSLAVRDRSLYLGLSSGRYLERLLKDGRAGHQWQLKRYKTGSASSTWPTTPTLPVLADVEPTKEVISSVAVSPDRKDVYIAIGSDRRFDIPETTVRISASVEHFGRVQTSDSFGRGSDLPFGINFDRPAFVPRGPGTENGLFEHENPVNVLVLDPQKPERVFIGCDVGVFRSEDKGESWTLWSRGLPNAVVTGIAIEAETPVGRPRMVRVATYGRGAWERSIDARDDDPTPARADLYLRPHAGFTHRPTPTAPDDPPKTEARLWDGPADLKIQRKRKGEFPKPHSTETYEEGGRIDHIGFELLPRKRLRRATDARIHVQAHNRGPALAHAVEVRLFWAPKTGTAYPALPADFWDVAIGLPMDTSVWKAIGGVVVLDRILPAEPRVATFDWTVPERPPTHVALLAIVTSADDPIVRPADAPFDVERLARDDKRVLLTTAKVERASQKSKITTGEVLSALGVIAVLGIVTYGTVRAIKDS